MADNAKPGLAIVDNALNRRRKVAPADSWSNIDQLPADFAREAAFSRDVEMYAGLVGLSGVGGQDKEGRLLSGLDRVAGIDPQDSIESMHARLMVQVYSAAMSSVAMARDAGFSSPVGAIHMGWFHKFTSLYMQQMGALDRRRGKVVQKVVVEKVLVNDGGQAFMGVVEGGNQHKQSAPEGQALKRARAAATE